jgi:hypothetical protein
LFSCGDKKQEDDKPKTVIFGFENSYQLVYIDIDVDSITEVGFYEAKLYTIQEDSQEKIVSPCVLSVKEITTEDGDVYLLREISFANATYYSDTRPGGSGEWYKYYN